MRFPDPERLCVAMNVEELNQRQIAETHCCSRHAAQHVLRHYQVTEGKLSHTNSNYQPNYYCMQVTDGKPSHTNSNYQQNYIFFASRPIFMDGSVYYKLNRAELSLYCNIFIHV